MAREIINVGAEEDDGTGEPLRNAWIKVNNMTSEIYTTFGDGSTLSSAGGVVPVEDDGTEIVATPTALNFTGAGVTVTDASGVATIDIPSGGTVDVVSNVATDTILGRTTAGSGDSEELTAAQVRTLLNVADGADVSPVTSVAGETGVISAGDLRTALNVEDGSTADQTGAEIVSALDTELGGSTWQSGGSAIPVEDDGSQIVAAPTALNFTGAGVTVTDVSGVATIDITGGGTVDVVSNVATDTILGRTTAGSGDSEELTAAQVRTLLNVSDGADVSPVTSVAGETGVISAGDLRTALNVEDGATADQTGAEIVSALDTELGSSTWQSGGSAIPVEDDGSQIVAAPTALNFTGAGVTVTDVSGVATIAISGGGTVDAVSNVATDTILGRTTAGSGDSEELTAADVRTLLNVEDGATADQTGAEIKSAYEAEADTNALTDVRRDKIDNITVTSSVDLDQLSTDVSALANGMVFQGSWDAS